MSRTALWFALLAVAGCSAGGHATLGEVDVTAAAAKSPAAGRRIIYEATLRLFVVDLAKLEHEIPELVKQCEGYLAQITIDRPQGKHRSGRWIARIPVDRYESFLAAVTKLGVADTFSQTSHDVTEEYVDLETRITNEKRLEDRILELLKKPEGELKEVIEVERELARVRGEIEKMEGRLRFLANQTEFTTVTIDAVETDTYVPVQAPTFRGRVAQSWRSSLLAMLRLSEDIFVCATYVLPWLLAIGIIICPAAWWLRVSRKRRAQATS